jgi:hypothetical protein
MKLINTELLIVNIGATYSCHWMLKREITTLCSVISFVTFYNPQYMNTKANLRCKKIHS